MTDPMPKLSVQGVSKSFQLAGRGSRSKRGLTSTQALLDISFDVREGELVSIIGPSGCGKSTLLKLVHSLIPADEGSISIDGSAVTHPGFDRALVFQHANLLPWRTVTRNVTLGLESMGMPRDEREAIAAKQLELVGLSGHEHFFPHELSGGMQQRVGLARALAVDPQMLLMDEPFGALDAQTRERLQRELLRILEETRKTVLFVTHDLDEAVYLGDRVVVLASGPGRIVEVIDIDIPKPRPESGALRADPAYVSTRLRLWELLSSASERLHAN